jgi:hypothetical protein
MSIDIINGLYGHSSATGRLCDVLGRTRGQVPHHIVQAFEVRKLLLFCMQFWLY